MKYIISGIGILWFLAVFVLLFKIADLFLRYKSITKQNDYKGFYGELSSLSSDSFFGMFPFFYVGENASKIENPLLSRRKKLVTFFWVLFLAGMLIALILELIKAKLI